MININKLFVKKRMNHIHTNGFVDALGEICIGCKGTGRYIENFTSESRILHLDAYTIVIFTNILYIYHNRSLKLISQFNVENTTIDISNITQVAYQCQSERLYLLDNNDNLYRMDISDCNCILLETNVKLLSYANGTNWDVLHANSLGEVFAWDSWEHSPKSRLVYKLPTTPKYLTYEDKHVYSLHINTLSVFSENLNCMAWKKTCITKFQLGYTYDIQGNYYGNDESETINTIYIITEGLECQKYIRMNGEYTFIINISVFLQDSYYFTFDDIVNLFDDDSTFDRDDVHAMHTNYYITKDGNIKTLIDNLDTGHYVEMGSYI